jgi:hypothetical protein
MTAWQIVISIIGGLIALGLIEIWLRFRISRFLGRVIARTKDSEKTDLAKLDPESRHIVRLSDTEVTHELPNGIVERVEWSDLNKVEVLTNDRGPFVPDVFWVLHGSTGGCVIPQGATGDAELLRRLQAIPGFDNDAFTKAMVSTDNQRFVCWERTQGPV